MGDISNTDNNTDNNTDTNTIIFYSKVRKASYVQVGFALNGM